jgi:hypothetical protein
MEHATHVPDGGINDSTPLLAQRVVSSLHVIEMIILIEHLSGRSVQVDQLAPDTFRNIDSIVQTFFSETNYA